jgi:anaerobic magnesium-protoporphyrin IX monomethyl ester cyclase
VRVALVNPAWDFTGSIYFGCRAPHLPLELGYARALLARAGHATELFDLHLLGGSAADVAAFRPDMTVVTTAPSYLFWRCPPPELRVPRDFLAALDGRGGRTVAVGPHGSATPAVVRRKLGVDVVIRGECEEAIVALADGRDPGDGLHEARFADLPALAWPDAVISRHAHHHHRFERAPDGPGAEVEASRGCPYACTFCAKLDFRDHYRRRHLPTLLAEIDRLAGQGVTYLYFIDEIFLPWRELLEALAQRGLAFGVQTRIDLWKPAMLELLGRAGCVSIEAGVESLSESGRAALAKDCRIDTDALTARLIAARRHVPFVQANLIATPGDNAQAVAIWRDELRAAGVWANDPVPLYPYPGSPDYRARWGMPDDAAWERAHAHYLAEVRRFSDIQDAAPLTLPVLEGACPA